MKKASLLFTVLFVFLAFASAQTNYSVKTLESMRKEAFKYRKDIPKDILKALKKNSKDVVLHGDWVIDNHQIKDYNGKTLVGEHLAEASMIADNLFLIYDHRDGVYCQGVSTKDNRLIVPCTYDNITPNYKFDLLICTKNVNGTYSYDIYNFDGKKLVTLNTDGKQHTYDIDCNLSNYVLSFKNPNGENYSYSFYYTNGEKAFRDLVCKGAAVYNDSVSYKDLNDNSFTEPLIKNSSEKISLRYHSERDLNENDNMMAANNFWFKQGVELLNAQKTKEALFCFNYFNTFEESNTLFQQASIPHLYAFTFTSTCLEMLGKYDDFNMHFANLKSIDAMFKFPYLTVDKKNNIEYNGLYSYAYNDSAIASIKSMIETLNTLQNTNVKNYAAMLQEKQEKSQLLGNILSGVLLGVAAGVAAGATSSNRNNNVSSSAYTPAAGVSSSSSSGHDNSARRAELERKISETEERLAKQQAEGLSSASINSTQSLLNTYREELNNLK